MPKRELSLQMGRRLCLCVCNESVGKLSKFIMLLLDRTVAIIYKAYLSILQDFSFKILIVFPQLLSQGSQSLFQVTSHATFSKSLKYKK